jgi:hypothetical protein
MAFDANRGACISCGFLSQRDSSGRSTGYYEVPPADRAAGTVGHPQARRPTVIWCFVAEANLKQEIEDLGNERPIEERTAQVIQRGDRGEHGCPQWMPYKEGLSPQEHYGGLAMQQQEQDRRNWERQLELDRRAFEKALWDQAQEAEEKRHNLVFWIAIAAVALAVAEVLAAILSAGPDSIIGKLPGL